MTRGKHEWRKFLSALLALILVLGITAWPVSAAQDTEAQEAASREEAGEPEEVPEITAPKIASPIVILMDADTGAVLYQRNMHEVAHPASLTKIMTTYLALKYGNLSDTVTMTEEGVALAFNGSSNLYTSVGEQFTLEQMLYGTMVKSANDMATGVGVHIAGSLAAFADLMNEEAAELGCLNTHFANACGYPDKDHTTTAYDLALISKAALQDETFRKMCGTIDYTIPPTNKFDDERYFGTHLAMMINETFYDADVFGGKTGYTDAAGECLASFAQRGDMTLISVILHSESQGDLLTDSKKILDYGFDSFEHIALKAPGIEGYEALGTIRKDRAEQEFVISDEVVTGPEGGDVRRFSFTKGEEYAGCVDIPEQAYQEILAEQKKAEQEAEEAAKRAEEEAQKALEAEAVTPTPVIERREMEYPHSAGEVMPWLDRPENKLLAGIAVLCLIALIFGIAIYIGNGRKRRARRRRKKKERQRRKQERNRS